MHIYFQGNILDDEVLIETLAQSKVTSDVIKIKVAEAEKTEIAIDETREACIVFSIYFGKRKISVNTADEIHLSLLYRFIVKWQLEHHNCSFVYQI
jgi:dynein heavy chain